LQRYGHSHTLGAYETPILGARGGRRGSAVAPLERAVMVSYRLSIVTVAICNHSAAICDRMSPTLKFLLVQTRHVGVAKSERPRLTKIMVKLFSKNSNLCDHNSRMPKTDGQTDRQTDDRHASAIPRIALKCIARKNSMARLSHAHTVV